MMALTPINLRSVAVIAASCDDIAIGAGATLIEIARGKPDLVVHALVLTGGWTEWEVEEKNAFAALCPSTDVRLTVADLPSARLPDHLGRLKNLLAEFRQDCEPDMVFGPHSGDHDQDRQLLCYPSQSGRGWSDDDAILGLMRVRGAQCRARYAEAFTVEKSVLDSGSDYSVN